MISFRVLLLLGLGSLVNADAPPTPKVDLSFGPDVALWLDIQPEKDWAAMVRGGNHDLRALAEALAQSVARADIPKPEVEGWLAEGNVKLEAVVKQGDAATLADIESASLFLVTRPAVVGNPGLLEDPGLFTFAKTAGAKLPVPERAQLFLYRLAVFLVTQRALKAGQDEYVPAAQAELKKAPQEWRKALAYEKILAVVKWEPKDQASFLRARAFHRLLQGKVREAQAGWIGATRALPSDTRAAESALVWASQFEGKPPSHPDFNAIAVALSHGTPTPRALAIAERIRQRAAQAKP